MVTERPRTTREQFLSVRFASQMHLVLLAGLVVASLAAFVFLIVKYEIGLPYMVPGLIWVAALYWVFLADERSWRLTLAAGLLISVVLRIAALIFIEGRQFGKDPEMYSTLADNLLSGQGLVLTHGTGIEIRAVYPPLYPILLAGARAVGGSGALTTLMLNSILDLLTALLIVHLGKILSARQGGRRAALLYLLLPTMIFSAPIPQKEGLSLLFIAAFVIGMARLADERYSAAKATLIIGATTAGMALTQPAFATLAVTMYVALFIWKREARSRIARSAVGAFAVCSVLMLPWWVRNYMLFGDFVPLTTAMGANLWMGMHGTTRNLPPELRSADLQELERYRAIGRAALELIAANPVAYVIDSFLKPVRALIFQDHVALKLMQFRPSLNGTEIRFLMPPLQLSYIFLLAAAARSLWSSRFARWHGFLIVALSAAFAQMFVFQIWFEFEERHRGYLIIILLMLIALGINESRKLRTQRQ